ncbi:MAG: hypothetical protein QM601_05795, partial [Pseudoxanthomonas sp.]
MPSSSQATGTGASRGAAPAWRAAAARPASTSAVPVAAARQAGAAPRLAPVPVAWLDEGILDELREIKD